MLFKNDGYMGELLLTTVKFVFHRLKNKINCHGKLLFCQGTVMEMSGNLVWTQMWQPCFCFTYV